MDRGLRRRTFFTPICVTKRISDVLLLYLNKKLGTLLTVMETQCKGHVILRDPKQTPTVVEVAQIRNLLS